MMRWCHERDTPASYPEPRRSLGSALLLAPHHDEADVDGEALLPHLPAR